MTPDPAFPIAEFEARLARLQKGMAAAGLGALLLSTPADIFYVSGFLTRFFESPTRVWFVVVPATGPPVAVIPAIGADLMGQTWLSDIRTWPAPRPEDDGVSLLTETLAGLVPRGGGIGLPMGLESHLRMPLGSFERLKESLGDRVFMPDQGVVAACRAVKSEPEIDRVRASCALAGAAFDRVPEIADPGAPLDQVFRRFQSLLLEEGADWVSYLAGGAGPDGYGDVISPATAQALAFGDVLMLDTGAVRQGYFCDYDRNFSVGGPPSLTTARAHHALWQATEEALAQLRVGMTAADLHRLMAGHLEASGQVPLAGRFGHGLGIQLTEGCSVQPGDQTRLQDGMILTLEPGVEIAPGRILVHEENLVLRADGAELLSPRAAIEMVEI